jgi:hypothetical protein
MQIEIETNGQSTSAEVDIRPTGVVLSTRLGDLVFSWESLYKLMATQEIAENLELVEIFNRDIPLNLLYKKT